jgi:hypothetical protein
MVLSRRELLKVAGLALFTPLLPPGTRPAQPVGKWILITGEGTPKVGGIGRWRAIRWRDGGLEMGGVVAPADRPTTAPWNTLWAAAGDAFCAAAAAGVLVRSGWRTKEFVLTWEGRMFLIPPVRPPVHDTEWLLVSHGLAGMVGEEPGNPFGGEQVLAAIERGVARAPVLDAGELAAFVQGAAPDLYRDELALRAQLRQLGAEQIVEIEATGT